MKASKADAGALPSERRRWLVMLALMEVEWAVNTAEHELGVCQKFL